MSYNVLLTSAGAPNSVGEYKWEHPDTVVSVPVEIATQLLRIHEGGFAEAPPYEALPKKTEEKETKKPAGRPRKNAPSAPPEPDESSDPLSDALDLVENKAKG